VVIGTRPFFFFFFWRRHGPRRLGGRLKRPEAISTMYDGYERHLSCLLIMYDPYSGCVGTASVYHVGTQGALWWCFGYFDPAASRTPRSHPREGPWGGMPQA
jgi:hypothetical protein